MHKIETGTKPSTEQAAQTDQSPPRPPRGNKESREDYFFEGPHFGEVVPISLRPKGFDSQTQSGLRSAQSPAGKDEKFSQSPAAEMRCVLAGWLLAGRRLAAACC